MAKEVTNTFWGVTLNAGKKYSQTLDSAVHVSMAALEPGSNGGDDEAVSVMIQHKKSDFMLCSLSGRHTFQQTLDLHFNEGEEVTFYLKGKGKVHLTGNLIPMDDDNYDSASDADFKPQSSFLESESADDDDDDDDDTSSEEDTESSKKQKRLLAALKQSKKPKVEIVGDDDEDDEDGMETDDDDDDDDDDDKDVKKDSVGKKRKAQATLAVPVAKKSKETKNEKHKETEKVLNNTSTVSESNQSESSEKKKKKKKRKNKKNESTSNDGTNLPTDKQVEPKSRIVDDVKIEEVKIGHGPEAKKGSTVHVYYTGKLPDGKVFDTKTSGKTFKFHLGKKEVISGWEVGVEGMKVGGKRKLVVPPKMGYGSQNVGGGNIPPNSTLHFEVELKAVN